MIAARPAHCLWRIPQRHRKLAVLSPSFGCARTASSTARKAPPIAPQKRCLSNFTLPSPRLSPSPTKMPGSSSGDNKRQRTMSSSSDKKARKPAHETDPTKGEQPPPPPQHMEEAIKHEHDTTTTHADEEALKKDPDQAWRNQPPYRTAEDNDSADKKHTAQCHCGRIKYWLTREKPLASKFCHCMDCQSLHGAPFQWAAIFHKDDLHFENGAKGLAFYQSAKKHTRHELPVKVSCAYCHAPIMDEGKNMVLMFPAIIRFKSHQDKKLFDPQMHIFYSRRVVDIPDGKPKWSGIDKDSELMEEN